MAKSTTKLKKCGNPCGFKRHQPGTVCPLHRDSKSLKSSVIKSNLRIQNKHFDGMDMDYTRNTLCSVLQRNGKYCSKEGFKEDGRCTRHEGQPDHVIASEDLPERASQHYGEHGFPGSFEHPTVIKYEYADTPPEQCYCDTDDYCDCTFKQSTIEDVTFTGYSPTAHAAAMSGTFPVQDKESFLFAAYVYAANNFGEDCFEEDVTRGHYGEEFGFTASKEDRNLVSQLLNASSADRLVWASEQTGIDLSDAKLQEYDMSDLEGIVEPAEQVAIWSRYSTEQAEASKVDVDLGVPLTILRNTPNGTEILWGESSLREMMSIQQNESNISKDPQPTKFLAYAV